MAYGGGITPGPGFSSCLDDVPFKLGPKFRPPAKVDLPPGFDKGLGTAHSSALHADYTFEVEEAVLKWSAERERQQEEQKRLEEERRNSQQRSSTNSESSECEADFGPGQQQGEAATSEPLYENTGSVSEHVYENTDLRKPKPAPRVRVGQTHNPNYSNVTLPSPLIANVSSNHILQPTQISTNGNSESKAETRDIAKEFDMTMFDKVDDPFDNVELQTINVMQELASVLTNKTNANNASPSPNGAVESVASGSAVNVGDGEATSSDTPVSDVVTEQNNQDIPLYENVQLKEAESVPKPLNGHISQSTNLSHLPPIPARRNLVGQSSPLPPIGRQSLDSLVNVSDQSQSNKCDGDDAVSRSANLAECPSSNIYANQSAVNRSYPKPLKPPPPVPKPPRTFRYSRHDLENSAPENGTGNINSSVSENSVNIQQNSLESDSGFSVKYRNTHSTPDLHAHTQPAPVSPGDGLNFVTTHFDDTGGAAAGTQSKPIPVPRQSNSPPPRPSSGQAWNRYSPLPVPGSGVDQPTSVSLPVVPARPAKPPSPYLSSEARASVDNLVTMGFPKDTVVRAVSKLGNDEKEVVEYLCLVDQLKEKGYSSLLVENALLLFQNNMQQASTYLELFTQLQELGFTGDKIQKALVETKNDREKTIDILTATS